MIKKPVNQRQSIIVLVLFLLVAQQNVEAFQTCKDNVVITIDRKTCFGDCPDYSAQIYSDGTVIYIGRFNVKEIGERRTKVSQQAIQELIKEFQRINYFALKDKYETDENGMSVTDQATTTTSICLDGKKKTVVNYLYAPKELDALEDKIDSLAGLYKFLGPL